MSSSNSSSATSTSNRDGRVAVDGEDNLGISAEGDVSVHMVADEAFELGFEAIQSMNDLAIGSIEAANYSTDVVAQTLGGALYATQEAAKTEEAQIVSQLIKIAVPVAALAYVAAKVMTK